MRKSYILSDFWLAFAMKHKIATAVFIEKLKGNISAFARTFLIKISRLSMIAKVKKRLLLCQLNIVKTSKSISCCAHNQISGLGPKIEIVNSAKH